MIRKTFIAICIILIITSCQNKERLYRYVEIATEESLLGVSNLKEKEADTIYAINDSSAYIEAYLKFIYSVKVSNDMKETFGKVYSIPKEFKLYDDKNNELSTSIDFLNKLTIEKQIKDDVFAEKNSLKQSLELMEKEKQEKFSKTAIIDSNKIKELEKFFRIKKDEFSNNYKTWYKPKSAPQYTNLNGIYLYFQKENGMPSNLRFRLQYYDDDWLFIKKVQFSIDGKAYEYIPIHTETDSGDGGYIWEWFDESVTESDKELINAISNAKSAKMKLIGSQYYDIKNITLEQIKSFKQTLELYKAFGANY